MEEKEYYLMYDLEPEHWWYCGLRELVLSVVGHLVKGKKDVKILDAGCGTGYLLKELEKHGTAFGVDISDIALDLCKKRRVANLRKASVEELPFESETFDVVVSTDVLYHESVKDDVKVINELSRVLKKGGYLIVNLPAYEFLRRAHDKRVQTRHRYTLTEICNKLKNSGFEKVKATYRNAALFPALLLLSMLKKDGRSDLKRTPRLMNELMKIMVRSENAVLKKVSLPFGTSVFCVMRKV